MTHIWKLAEERCLKTNPSVKKTALSGLFGYTEPEFIRIQFRY